MPTDEIKKYSTSDILIIKTQKATVLSIAMARDNAKVTKYVAKECLGLPRRSKTHVAQRQAAATVAQADQEYRKDKQKLVSMSKILLHISVSLGNPKKRA